MTFVRLDFPAPAVHRGDRNPIQPGGGGGGVVSLVVMFEVATSAVSCTTYFVGSVRDVYETGDTSLRPQAFDVAVAQVK